jgi:CheY-like chemotaxis protein
MLIGVNFFAIQAQARSPQLHMPSVRADARNVSGGGWGPQLSGTRLAARACVTDHLHSGAGPRLSVLVLNSSADTREMLHTYLASRGLAVSTSDLPLIRSGVIDGGRLIAGLDPDVIVIDVALPYEVNWRAYLDLQRHPFVQCPIVVTTTNERALARIVGAASGLIELVGKPYDLGQLYDAIVRAAALDQESAPESHGRRTGDRRAKDRRSGTPSRD